MDDRYGQDHRNGALAMCSMRLASALCLWGAAQPWRAADRFARHLALEAEVLNALAAADASR